MERQQTVQAIVQRAHEISGGSPPMASVQTQAMGAPPSSMNLATGGPQGMGPSPVGPQMSGMQDPSMQGGMPPMGQQGMDPSMMGGDPQTSGAPFDPAGMGLGGQQGMQDPSMMGQPGMDPSMQGMQGMQGMQDPSMMGQPGMDPSMQGMQQQQPPPPMAMMPQDGPSRHDMMSEINPQFLHDAARLQSEDVFDSAAVAMLAQSPALHSIVSEYLPNLEKSVDNLARVMLTLWMQEVDLRERVGEATFEELEKNLQSTFRGMGDLVLRLARGAQGAKEPELGESGT
jgi:hypothetical protein